MPTQPYNWNGKRVKGVTTIISHNLGWNKQQLMHWAWKQGCDGLNYREVATRAADIGTNVHALVEADLHGCKHPTLTVLDKDDVRKVYLAFDAYLDWKEGKQFEPVAIEQGLVGAWVDTTTGLEYPFGGTIDSASVLFRGKKLMAIVDLKSSNGTYPDHKIQLAAYGFLWNQNYPEQKIERYQLLRVDKNDGSFHHHSWLELDNAWQAFTNLLRLDTYSKML